MRQTLKPEKNFFFPTLFVTGVFLAIISGSFLTEGMFLDGVIYSAVAKSLSQGVGSFWDLSYADGSPFVGHPPLAIGLQSLFYHLLGDNWHVDKIYSVFTIFISAIILFFIWKELEMELRNFWMVLLLWLLVPTVFWSSTNNLLENTMSVFILLSVWAYLKSLKSHRFIYCFLQGVMLFLAFLCKGFTGLYPLALPFFYWLFTKDRKFINAVQDTLFVLSGLVIAALLTFSISTTAFHCIENYLRTQVIFSLSQVKTTDSRFFILLSFLSDMIIPSIIVISVLVIGKLQKSVAMDSRNARLCCIFFAVALSGVIPIMISMKQSSFYIITIFPYTALALGCLISPTITNIRFSDKTRVIFRSISVLVFILSIGLNIYFCGKVGRDKDMLADIHAILPYIPEKTTVGTTIPMKTNYHFWAYLERYQSITYDITQTSASYLITSADDNTADSSYCLIETGAKDFYLYKRND